MSPFSQLGSALGGFSNRIDHEFSPVVRYIDEFDRHFSHRHRFMNCFIPRFDLEEDSRYYYLYGEVPGAKVEDITIEAHNDNTLVINGRTNRPYASNSDNAQRESPRSNTSDQYVKVPIQDSENGGPSTATDGNTYITVDASDAEKPAAGYHGTAAPKGMYPDIDRRDPNPPAPRPANFITVDVSDAEKPRSHHFHPNRLVEHEDSEDEAKQEKALNQRRALLSERLVGDFHRTFTFPCPIVEAGIKASMENGLLQLIVPKAEGKGRGRRIHIGRNEQAGAGL